ncbi:hypothetical protein [Levilactobacillus yiduensis]|uniref:hypothetical protein n=1 Tax=Levilactobacillus yiduensis TaxID=2953880 RepID=UPI000EF30049|nr:hypothetical protein [Levilactobacillus yiduensis]AYM01912.1 hypothetical protein D8911_02475 [Levilactobacillus brevis]
MKKTWIIAATLMGFGVLGGLGQTQTASAATKLGTSVPKSLRGTWYSQTSQAGIRRIQITGKTFYVSTGFFNKGKWQPNWNGGKVYKLSDKVVLNKTFTISAKNNKAGYRTISMRHDKLLRAIHLMKRVKGGLRNRTRTYSNAGVLNTDENYLVFKQHANAAKYFKVNFGMGSYK